MKNLLRYSLFSFIISATAFSLDSVQKPDVECNNLFLKSFELVIQDLKNQGFSDKHLLQLMIQTTQELSKNTEPTCEEEFYYGTLLGLIGLGYSVAFIAAGSIVIAAGAGIIYGCSKLCDKLSDAWIRKMKYQRPAETPDTEL